jgi:hypothetical protein
MLQVCLSDIRNELQNLTEAVQEVRGGDSP